MKDPLGIGEFIFGLFLIPFSMVMLWKNEAKLVTYMKLLTKGQEAVKTLDFENPDDANEFDLAHMTGTTVNTDEIEDKEFGIKVPNSYRLKRKVEMYQWKEHVEYGARDRNGNEDRNARDYTYEKVWSEEKISSAGFAWSAFDHTNPDNEWPFTSQTLEAKEVKFGKFNLTANQISRLGAGRTQNV